uniref:Secreted protein n=1 Tax=Macrostomum lignano TaxID=282301 RepID=A0A1I8JC20_9PLAT
MVVRLSDFCWTSSFIFQLQESRIAKSRSIGKSSNSSRALSSFRSTLSSPSRFPRQGLSAAGRSTATAMLPVL